MNKTVTVMHNARDFLRLQASRMDGRELGDLLRRAVPAFGGFAALQTFAENVRGATMLPTAIWSVEKGAIVGAITAAAVIALYAAAKALGVDIKGE